ncbi:MAG: UDP-glucose dehydrogenase family protein [Nitrososphaerales archaeon]
MTNISVAGVGKLGLCMAAVFTSKGYNVIGVDINPKVIKTVNQGRSPFYELGIDALLSRNRVRLKMTDDFQYATDISEVTFIVVNTPSNEDGSYSMKQLSGAAEMLGQSLKSKTGYHLVVVTSTVLPGTTRKVVKPILEKFSGKRCPSDFGLCYNPEFIALGSVIHDFQNPDFVLIGESDEASGRLLSSIYRKVCSEDVRIARMSIENAELAKIALNSYITMKISFVNTLAEICENLEGGDVDAITSAIGLDRRIGSRYLKGGLAFGGPCFPRDNKAFEYAASELGCQAKIAQIVDDVNKIQINRVIDLLSKYGSQSRVAILGLAYKPNTNIVEESAALKIAKGLLALGFDISVYDPVAMSNAKSILGNGGVYYADSLKACISDADVVVVATPWDEFKELTPEDFKNTGDPVLVDCWRIFDRDKFDSKLKYVGLGLNSKLPSNSC